MTGKYQTLHGHTTASDGKLSHLEVLKVCEENNVGVMGFTDHDAVLGEDVVEKLKKYTGQVKWISGIEISADVHVVGLFVDPFSKELITHCQKAQAARIERMEKTVTNLQSIGFEITEEVCLAASKGEAVGRPHIVEALKLKAKNLQILEGLRLKMEKDAQGDKILKEKYDKMMKAGERQYPYQILLSDDAYVKGVYVDYTYRVDIDQSVKLIRDAGGVALMAHWFTYKKKYPIKEVSRLLADNRLDGVETVSGLWTGDKVDRESIVEDRRLLQELTVKYDKVEGGGVDAHNEEDFKLFAQTDWYNQWTVGMVEKIIKKSGVDTTWSSLQ